MLFLHPSLFQTRDYSSSVISVYKYTCTQGATLLCNICLCTCTHFLRGGGGGEETGSPRTRLSYSCLSHTDLEQRLLWHGQSRGFIPQGFALSSPASFMSGYLHVWRPACLETCMSGYLHVWRPACLETFMSGDLHV